MQKTKQPDKCFEQTLQKQIGNCSSLDKNYF